MTIGILQPGYLPWLGFFEQMYKSDTFVIYDDVQYNKGSWRNRNRIKTSNGIQWLTVPVMFNLRKHQLIKYVKIDNKIDWKSKHLSSIKFNYSKSPFYKTYIGIFEETYSQKWEYLIDIDMYFITKLSEILGIKKKNIVMSSTLNVDGDKLGRLINICKLFSADIFYEGAAGRNYIDENYFAEHGIKVKYQDYKHPVYNQLYGNFVSYLSIIDLLFNHGKDSLLILTGKICIKRSEVI